MNTPTQRQSIRIAGIDAIRAIAALLVVSLHCGFNSLTHTDIPDGFIRDYGYQYVLALGNCGVPLFLITSGYFLHLITAPSKLTTSITKILKLWGWMIVGMLCFYVPLWLFSEGDRFSVDTLCNWVLFPFFGWFLRALVIWSVVLYGVRRLFRGQWIYLMIIPLIYIELRFVYVMFLGFRWYAEAPMYMLVGMWIYEHRQLLSKLVTNRLLMYAIAFFFVALVAETTLRIYLEWLDPLTWRSLMSAPLCVCLFLLAKSDEVKWPKWLSHIGRHHSPYIYVLHFAVLQIVGGFLLKLGVYDSAWTPLLMLTVGFAMPMLLVEILFLIKSHIYQ